MILPADYTKMDRFQRRACREQYIVEQEGKCAHCGADLKGPPPKEITNLWINRRLFPEGFFMHPVHLHHNHDTGMTIGAVHNTCNAVLWQYLGE